MQFRHAVLIAAVTAAASLQAANVVFTVNYTDTAGEGFNDPTLGTARKTAFQHALGIWGGHLEAGYVGETIHVDASFDPLGGTPTSALLGQAGSQYVWNVGGTTYGDALANHVSGYDRYSAAEIRAQFNSDVDNGTVLGATNWYYGFDGVPGIHEDFVTVALHEIGHGLNFFDTINSTTGAWDYSNPGAYDRFLWDNAIGKRLDDPSVTNTQRRDALTGSSLFWDGQYGKAGNGGVRPEIYAPNPYEPGSSISHLDEVTYGGELMSPWYSGPDHEPSLTELGMLQDMGWTLVPEPGIVMGALAVLMPMLGHRRRTR